MNEQSPDSLLIETPSRLHFGLLSFGQNGSVRQYGGVGVMLAEPRLKVLLHSLEQVNTSNQITNENSKQSLLETDVSELVQLRARCKEFVTRIESRLGLKATQLRPVEVKIVATPRAHIGLGSGTQLGLALAAGVARWNGVVLTSVAQLVQMAGRAERSSVGSHGFIHGGLIVEAGKLPGESIAPLSAQIKLPSAWRVLLICPRVTRGLSGMAEKSAFATLPPVPLEVTRQLGAEILFELLPAAQTGHFAKWSESVYRYGIGAGNCFATQQGGPFANEQIAARVARLRELGIAGVGQSSWGPLIFAWCESECAASELQEKLLSEPLFVDCDFQVSTIAQHGATVNGEAISM